MDDIDIELNAEATAALMAIQAAWATRMARANLEFLRARRNGGQPAQVTQEPRKRKKTRHPFRQRGNPREA